MIVALKNKLAIVGSAGLLVLACSSKTTTIEGGDAGGDATTGTSGTSGGDSGTGGGDSGTSGGDSGTSDGSSGTSGNTDSGHADGGHTDGGSDGSLGDGGSCPDPVVITFDGPDGGTACDTCAHTNCQTELDACFDDTSAGACECRALDDCVVACPDQQCVNACAQAHQAGVQRELAWQTCVYETACGPADAGDAGDAGGSGVCE